MEHPHAAISWSHHRTPVVHHQQPRTEGALAGAETQRVVAIQSRAEASARRLSPEFHSWLRNNLGIWDELEMPTHQEYTTIEHLLRMRARADERPEFVRTRVLSEMAIESVRVRERVSSAISSSISWSRELTQVRQCELAS